MPENESKESWWMRVVDPLTPTVEHAEERYRFGVEQRHWLLPGAFGLGLLLVSLVALLTGHVERFLYSYLVGWSFCLTLALGSLFFIMVHHITKAYWSVVYRRLAEAVAWSFPLLALLVIPILVGLPTIYEWAEPGIADPASSHFDEITAGKVAFLNVPFFLIRLVLYFSVWTILAYKFYSISVRSDYRPRRDTNRRLRFTSGWGIPLFAITLYFAAMDLLMSLDPHWYSTIFGVYFFAGSFLAAICFLTLAAAMLQRRGQVLRKTITAEHYHDMGKWMFALVVFWAYIGTSQYLLIWYADIPETTHWYHLRLEGGWELHSQALVFFHFLIPFFLLLSRATKRYLPALSILAGWLLFMHWFDLHWVTMPNFYSELTFHWVDFTVWLGLFGLFISAFIYRIGRHSLIPQKDAYLSRSLRFENV